MIFVCLCMLVHVGCYSVYVCARHAYGPSLPTEEEISEMAKALEKYGIQMPHFGKIGGILANEMGYDEAAS